jgi:hypothetical protein
MSEDDTPTCGKGIAANAVLPERIAALLSAMAAIYENHMRALDAGEANGKAEIDAYTRLMRDFSATAGEVGALADAMRSYRTLPMAEHNMDALMDVRSVVAMEALVVAQEELGALLTQRASEFRKMLDGMKQG